MTLQEPVDAVVCCQVVQLPVSLQHLLLDEGGTDTVVYRAAYSDYFHTDTKLFPAVEFLAELLQYLPDSRRRNYGRRQAGERLPEVDFHHSDRAHLRTHRQPFRRNGESPLTCSRCHKPMKVIAVITDSAQVLKILRHLIKTGKPPPALDPDSLN